MDCKVASVLTGIQNLVVSVDTPDGFFQAGRRADVTAA